MASAARGSVEITGLSAVVRDLQRIGVDVDDLKDAFSKIAAEGAAVVAALAPKKSGRLAADIRGNRAKSKAVVTAGRSAIPYAGPINYGWPKRGIEAAGFMQAGDQQLQPIAAQRLETEINAVIRKRNLT